MCIRYTRGFSRVPKGPERLQDLLTGFLRLYGVRSTTWSSLGRRTRATPSTTTARSTGPYDRHLRQHLIDHGIYPDIYSYPDGRVLP